MKRLTFTLTLIAATIAAGGLALAQGINPKDGRPADPGSPIRQPGVPLGQGSPFCSAPSVAIPDNSPAGVTDNLIVGASFTLTDLDVSLLVAHSWVGDLTATVSHSGGCSVTIVERPGNPASTFGCSSNNIDATLDDEAGSPAENACNPAPPALSGPLSPNNPLSACDGENVNGTWSLTVSDAAAGDTGTLNEWCLVTSPVPVELMEFHID